MPRPHTFEEVQRHAKGSNTPNYHNLEPLTKEVYEIELMRYLIDKQNCEHTCYWAAIGEHYCLFCGKYLRIKNEIKRN